MSLHYYEHWAGIHLLRKVKKNVRNFPHRTLNLTCDDLGMLSLSPAKQMEFSDSGSQVQLEVCCTAVHGTNDTPLFCIRCGRSLCCVGGHFHTSVMCSPRTALTPLLCPLVRLLCSSRQLFLYFHVMYPYDLMGLLAQKYRKQIKETSCLSFWDWFCSLNVIRSGYIHFSKNDLTLFFTDVKNSVLYIYAPFVFWQGL